ncbi:hypothetical protein FACS1894211_14010 [Clostridia bacterium]|nr:hypothetical protein FACS1894211_14010 [Clostridia bacterium]
MKPLGSLKYFWENKRKALLVIGIFILTAVSISFTASLVTSAFVSAEKVSIHPFDTASIAAAADGSFFLKEETVQKIEGLPNVGKTLSVDVETTSYTSLMGNAAAFILMAGERAEDVARFYDLKIKAGRMPAAGEYELALHEDVLRNKKLAVGDEIGDAIDEGEWLMGRYRIVGSLAGDTVLGVGSKSYRASAMEQAGIDLSGHAAALLLLPSGAVSDLNADLSALSKSEAKLYTKITARRDFDEQLASIQTLIGLVLAVFIFAMAIAVGAIIMVAYGDRRAEFGILFAIGYSKRDVRNMICKEIGVLSLVSAAAGYGFAMLLLFLLDALVFAPIGKPLAFFSVYGLGLTLIVPVMVFVCAVFPILRRFKKTDLVSVIEGQ